MSETLKEATEMRKLNKTGLKTAKMITHVQISLQLPEVDSRAEGTFSQVRLISAKQN